MSATAIVPNRAGVLVYGPKCAALAGLIDPPKRTRAPVHSRPVGEDARQMALELTA